MIGELHVVLRPNQFDQIDQLDLVACTIVRDDLLFTMSDNTHKQATRWVVRHVRIHFLRTSFH
jgi:hypothetical protein